MRKKGKGEENQAAHRLGVGERWKPPDRFNCEEGGWKDAFDLEITLNVLWATYHKTANGSHQLLRAYSVPGTTLNNLHVLHR